jgi:hypothetical protein
LSFLVVAESRDSGQSEEIDSLDPSASEAQRASVRPGRVRRTGTGTGRDGERPARPDEIGIRTVVLF